MTNVYPNKCGTQTQNFLKESEFSSYLNQSMTDKCHSCIFSLAVSVWWVVVTSLHTGSICDTVVPDVTKEVRQWQNNSGKTLMAFLAHFSYIYIYIYIYVHTYIYHFIKHYQLQLCVGEFTILNVAHAINRPHMWHSSGKTWHDSSQIKKGLYINISVSVHV
jgi:hypothetical protein